MHDSGSQHPRRCSRVPIFRAPIPRAPILPRANLPRADLPRTDLPRAVLSCRSSRTPIFPSAVLPHADFNAHRSLRAPFFHAPILSCTSSSARRSFLRAGSFAHRYPTRRYFPRTVCSVRRLCRAPIFRAPRDLRPPRLVGSESSPPPSLGWGRLTRKGDV